MNQDTGVPDTEMLGVPGFTSLKALRASGWVVEDDYWNDGQFPVNGNVHLWNDDERWVRGQCHAWAVAALAACQDYGLTDWRIEILGYADDDGTIAAFAHAILVSDEGFALDFEGLRTREDFYWPTVLVGDEALEWLTHNVGPGWAFPLVFDGKTRRHARRMVKSELGVAKAA